MGQFGGQMGGMMGGQPQMQPQMGQFGGPPQGQFNQPQAQMAPMGQFGGPMGGMGGQQQQQQPQQMMGQFGGPMGPVSPALAPSPAPAPAGPDPFAMFGGIQVFKPSECVVRRVTFLQPKPGPAARPAQQSSGMMATGFAAPAASSSNLMDDLFG